MAIFSCFSIRPECARQNVYNWIPAVLQTSHSSILLGETIGRIHHHFLASIRPLSWRRLEVSLTMEQLMETVACHRCLPYKLKHTHTLTNLLFAPCAVPMAATSTSPCCTISQFRWHCTGFICFILPLVICWHRTSRCSSSAPSNRLSFCRFGKVRVRVISESIWR